MIEKNLIAFKTLCKIKLKNTSIGGILISIRSIYSFLYWKTKRLLQGSSLYVFDPDRMYWIDPKTVEFRSKRARYVREEMGKVLDGDWDLWNVTWDNHDEVRWLEERFVYGKSWEETELYESILSYINTGIWQSPYNDSPENFHFVIDKNLVKEDVDYFGSIYETKIELDKRCKELDELHDSIKRRGVLPMSELVNGIAYPWDVRDNIIIDIGRHGDLLFADGKHRFALSDILRLSKIPVVICKRHKLWVDLRNEVAQYLAKHGKVYQPLTHIDLADFPSIHSSYRFDLIKETLSFTSGSLLDIGANWGYFSIKFEELGFNCTAIENEPESIYFMRKLRRAENRDFEIVESDILGYKEKSSFDIVLALSIFHHLIKTKSLLNQLIGFLDTIDMKVMYFQPNLKGEPTMKNSYRDFGPEAFVDFILEHSCLNNAKQIGIEPETGRPVFMLAK